MRSTMKPSTAGIFMILLGGLALYLGFQGLSERWDLLERGEKARGKVVKIEYLSRSKPSETPTFTPIVEWTAVDGRVLRGKGRESSPREDSFRIGEAYDVYYDPGDPEGRNYIIPADAEPAPSLPDYVPLVIGFIFLPIGIRILIGGRKGRTS